MADQHETSEPTAPASLEVAVQAGDAEEDLTALLQLRDQLTDHYRPSGPVEELLADRIVGLHWRLRRVARNERGRIAGRTEDVIEQRETELKTDSDDEQRYSFGTSTLDSSNPVTIARGLREMTELRDLVKQGEAVDLDYEREALTQIFGCGADDLPRGLGAEIVLFLAILEDDGEGMVDVAEEDRPAKLDSIRRTTVRKLGKLIKGLDHLRVLAQADADTANQAAVEASAMPLAHDLQALARWEQHLVKSLDVAETALRREQARRRMRGAILAHWRDRWH
jgi:hypothetical protein